MSNTLVKYFFFCTTFIYIRVHSEEGFIHSEEGEEGKRKEVCVIEVSLTRLVTTVKTEKQICVPHIFFH